jgi:hypothetical protein
MSNPCKQNFIDLVGNDFSWWAKYLNMEERILRRIIAGKWTIHIQTAQRIIDRINEQTWDKLLIDFYFEASELKGNEKSRWVIYSYNDNLSDSEKASIVRYIIEKRWHAFAILDIFIFLLFVWIIGIILFYFFQ